MREVLEYRKEYLNEYIAQFRIYNSPYPKKFQILTFGCQMNENDSERIAGMLCEMGFAESDSVEDSDVIVFNTCCVRKGAEDRIYGRIGALKGLKTARPSAIIAAGGCMMQQKGVVDYVRKKYRHVDIVFGTHNLHELPIYLYDKVFNNANTYKVLEVPGYVVEDVPVRRTGSIRAYTAVAFGCSNHCSYCVVPSVRGAERSRTKEDIISELRLLAESGTKEVMLLGQNVNSYGADLYGKPVFGDLLRDIEAIDGLERVRFMTSHPKDLSIDLIRAMKECGKVCEHLHLPIQSGSDRILSLMNRKYTRAHYLDLIALVRESIPGIALTTDIITGFPGETEADFSDTLDIISRVRFDMAYTFIYSERKGTPAAQMPGKIPPDIIRERFDRLTALQNDISKEINYGLQGRVVEVLVEGRSKTDPEKYSGRTRTNKIVNFADNADNTGRLVMVRVDKAGTWSLDGVGAGAGNTVRDAVGDAGNRV